MVLKSALITFLVLAASAKAEEEIEDENQNNVWFRRYYDCPYGWVQRCDKCYLPVTENKQWIDAQYHCRRLGGDLVTIKDFYTNHFIARVARRHIRWARTIWIGGHDRRIEGRYEWSDGSRASRYDFRWAPGEPNDDYPGEDCVEMFVRGRQRLWNDQPCQDTLPFVCQMDACYEGQFRCDNGRCVTRSAICDRVNDCGDNSDEKDCAVSCGGIFKTDNGSFATPNYPYNYENEADCTWVISLQGKKKIELFFLNFHVEDGFDFAEVFDGPSRGSRRLRRLTGFQRPTNIFSSGNSMTVRFTSDDSINKKGFNATYRAITETCGGDLQVNPGQIRYITSPQYPSSYPSNAKCIWTIRSSDPSQVISIVVVDFDTEPVNDVLDVRDGKTDKDFLLARLSGILYQQTYITSGSNLHLQFTSNYHINKRGFKVLIRGGCYAELNVSQGIVSSPGFGKKNYPNNLDCIWKIREPQNKSINFIFHFLDTERGYDFVYVKNGFTDQVIQKYDGPLSKEGSPGFFTKTAISCVMIRFTSDYSYVKKGFNATFSIDCPPLTPPDHGSLSSQESYYGITVTYSCDRGYKIINGDTRTCLYGGKWTKKTPSCKAIICGHPGSIDNGYFTTSGSFYYNKTVTYFCNKGYKLNGTKVRRCQYDGYWSGSLPKCLINNCGDPGTPKNGYRKSNETTVGSKIEFACDTGYKLVGLDAIVCQQYGNWTGPIPECQLITCSIPKAPQNGKIVSVSVIAKASNSRRKRRDSPPEEGISNSADNNDEVISNNNNNNNGSIPTEVPYSHLVSFACNTGFALKGSSSIQCQDDGTFNDSVPGCDDVDECLTRPCKGNGSICTNNVGSFQCSCEYGYRLVPNNTCVDVNECMTANGGCDQNCTNSLGSFKCVCEKGYYLYTGNGEIVPGATPNRTCLGVECSKPPPFSNGVVSGHGNRYPTILTHICYKGYLRKGGKNVKCMASGNWSAPFPTCEMVNCGDPGTVDHATRNLTAGFGYGSIAKYMCIEGYKQKSGNSKIECQANETHAFWSGILPVCERKDCGSLTPPLKGYVTYENGTKFGDKAVYSCRPGYDIMEGNVTRVCQASGQWSGTEPFCIPQVCPDPGVPSLGKRVGQLYVDQTVTYSCILDGYTLVGDINRTCQFVNGTGPKWTGSLPECKDTMPPKFNISCPSVRKLTLPKSESTIFHTWDIPVATDNSGIAPVVTSHPNISSPRMLNLGTTNITYKAMDSSKNNATCLVSFVVEDKEPPTIQCPSNINHRSDLSVQILWQSGNISDNIGIASVVFSPPNGSIFESAKTHKVEMTATDTSGNQAKCVMEVKITGCGCDKRNNSCKFIRPRNGIETCVIDTNFPVPLVSCNINCPHNYSFVDPSFDTTSIHCPPPNGWIRYPAPGCSVNRPIIACKMASLRVNYTNSINAALNSTQIQSVIAMVKQKLAVNCTSQFVDVKIENTLYESVMPDLIINASIKFELQKMAPMDGQLASRLDQCITFVRNSLAENNASLTGFTGNISNVASCCGSKTIPCCPSGHALLNNTYVGNSYCVACTPGMFFNESSNKCESCDFDQFQPQYGKTSCNACPSGSGTPINQATSCIAVCPPGKYSSDGFGPACRKCDKGEYQPSEKSTGCQSCPAGNTTMDRGATNVTDCRAPCPPGHVSDTGLVPCRACPLGTYQPNSERFVCYPCPGGGRFGGKQGAASINDCPSNDSCASSPCLNNGTCTHGEYTYTCSCLPWWTGKNCEINIDECASSPCQNNGTCHDKVNGYTCACAAGFNGTHCERNIDDCENRPCKNGAECVDGIASFTCNCQPGFTGATCNVNINECASGPCLNNGTCVDEINLYECICLLGYEGYHCENETNECLSNPCLNNATCVDLFNDYKCQCKPGYEGKDCGTDTDECRVKPCANNASCVDKINDYECICPPGYSGKNCSVNIDECASRPCVNNGTCTDQINDYKCDCLPGFKGKQCEREINECLPKPCLNNATCMDKINAFKCICKIGYEGPRCENETNECSSNPCVNGTCQDLLADYKCNCTPGFTGRNCDKDIDECKPNPCKNLANCTDRVNGYDCSCLPGFSGVNCETNIDDCSPDPCNGNAKNCTDMVNDFLCSCKPGYRGKACEIELDFCQPNPCQHNSTCINLRETESYKCNCTYGYEGMNCENETNECQSNPCQNGGTCTDLIGGYNCSCPSGLTGVHCEINIDDCRITSTIEGHIVVSQPCKNGGRCIDLINSYRCDCPITHIGQHCEKGIFRHALCDIGNFNENVHYETSLKSGYTWYMFTCTGNTTFPSRVSGTVKPYCARSPRFDLQFPGGMNSYLNYSNLSSAQELTLSVWVRYSGSSSMGTFLMLADEAADGTITPFLKINEREVTIYGNGSYLFTGGFTKRLNDGIWHHLVIGLNGASGQVEKLYQDKTVIISSPLSLNAFKGKQFFSPSGVILLADKGNSTFKGEISQLGIWSRGLSDLEIEKLRANCSSNLTDTVISWIQLSANIGSRVVRIEPMSCGSNKCPPAFTGQFCETEIDKVPPTVVSCPNSTKFVSVGRTSRVSWTEPVFTDNKGVTVIEKSHYPNQIFAWGDYIINYLAKDAFGNAAKCTFELFVMPFDCPPLIPPVKGARACGSWQWGRFCDAKCYPNHKFSVNVPPFYSCGRTGTWSHGPPTYPDNPSNRLPDCSPTTKAKITGSNSVTYAAASCDENFLIEFRKSFIRLIEGVQKYWPICGASCDFTNIGIKCSTPNRARRNVGGLSASITVSIPIQNAGNASYADQVQTGLKTNAFNLTVSVNGSALDSASNGITTTVKTECDKGSILKGQTCILCAAGTYHNVSNNVQCQICPIGSYQDKPGSLNCTFCPKGSTTFSFGSNSSSDCKVICQPGHYYNQNLDKCEQCLKGFYQALSGKERCDSCPTGKTTDLGATSRDNCSASCALGEELDTSDSCVKCSEGTYRSMANQTGCQPCPYSRTTYMIGATSLSYCRGSMANQTGCQPCPYSRTTYMIGATSLSYCRGSMANQTGCQPCPYSRTTYMIGATSLSYCRGSMANQTGCQPCPYSRTTYMIGATSLSYCRAICPVGNEVTPDGKSCMACQTGSYRKDKSKSHCIECPGQATTKQPGATSDSSCFVISTSTKKNIGIKLTGETWDPKLSNTNSSEFRALAAKVSSAIVDVYKNEAKFQSVKVTSFRKGSVIAAILLYFDKTLQDPLSVLRSAVSSGSVGGLPINSSHPLVDVCAPVTCKPNQECKDQNGSGICQCRPGYYKSAVGNECYRDCEYHYCLNKGKCSRGPNGRICKCPEGYSGNRCENERGVSVGIIVGCALAVFVLVVTVGYIYYKNKKQRYSPRDKIPLDEKTANGNHYTVIVHKESPTQTARTFENPVAIESVKKEEADGYKSATDPEQKEKYEDDGVEDSGV